MAMLVAAVLISQRPRTWLEGTRGSSPTPLVWDAAVAD
jgi:hypothetical protein